MSDIREIDIESDFLELCFSQLRDKVGRATVLYCAFLRFLPVCEFIHSVEFVKDIKSIANEIEQGLLSGDLGRTVATAREAESYAINDEFDQPLFETFAQDALDNLYAAAKSLDGYSNNDAIWPSIECIMSAICAEHTGMLDFGSYETPSKVICDQRFFFQHFLIRRDIGYILKHKEGFSIKYLIDEARRNTWRVKGTPLLADSTLILYNTKFDNIE